MKTSVKILGLAAFAAVTLAVTQVRADSYGTIDLTLNSVYGGSNATDGSAHWGMGAIDFTYAGGNIYTYCIDINRDINYGVTYKYTIEDLDASLGVGSPPRDPAITDTSINELKYLYANFYGKSGTPASTGGLGVGGSQTANDSSAFQLAIWEILYPSAPITADSGTNPTDLLKTSPSTYYDITDAAAYMSGKAIDNGSGTVGNFVGKLYAYIGTDPSSSAQDQAFYYAPTSNAPPPGVVPAPATASAGAGLLGLIAVGSLFGAYRRRLKVA